MNTATEIRLSKDSKTATTAWREFASIYNRESEFVVRQMSILFTAFYPWNF